MLTTNWVQARKHVEEEAVIWTRFEGLDQPACIGSTVMRMREARGDL